MTQTVSTYPAVALSGITIFPGTVAHFDVVRDRYLKAIEDAMKGGQEIFIVTRRRFSGSEPSREDLCDVGVLAKIRQLIRIHGQGVRVLAEATHRAYLTEYDTQGKMDVAAISPIFDDDEIDGNRQMALIEALSLAAQRFEAASGRDFSIFQREFGAIRDPRRFIYAAVNYFPLYYEKKQEILEALTLEDAYERLLLILYNEIEIKGIRSDFENKVKEKVDKTQRDYILREQLRVIHEELGDSDAETEADEFRNELEKINASPGVKEKIKKEIDRYAILHPQSSENSVSRGYIETLLGIPWEDMSEDNTDLKNVKEVLDKDHYGMDKVKERILEFLAVRILTQKGDAPIVCLVGPPGTGKTSIAHSVANALEKEFIRIHLGGVRDEAEIRGHRRTYVGAMPGRIVKGLLSAKVKNPLMLLDEVDKVSNDYKGDTFSALLEVLDPDQNNAFQDHYVEIPVDLSEVLFIATANTVDTIPRPLLDRMEVIEVSSYTENEKLHIAREHLIDKQFKKNGLLKKQLSIGKRPLEKIIRNYTREAGVRNLERRIGEICRKAARKILEDEESSIKITTDNLEEFLGKEKYRNKKKGRKNEIGITRGLAWTQVGGETLVIEVNVMPGKGEVVTTGQLGDVMKESAKASVSYIRSIIDRYKIDKEFFKENDIHIHIPEGAVPKDGPSAGITMATAILSAIAKIPVRHDVTMTGEVTLRGRVLPIGGLKEKLLAAKRAGMKKVLVPEDNRPDVEEISGEITDGLEIVFVTSMEEVLDEALVK